MKLCNYRDWLNEKLIKCLLRGKREVRGNDDMTKEINRLQRMLEAEYGEYGVVLCDEYSCEPGYSPDYA